MTISKNIFFVTVFLLLIFSSTVSASSNEDEGFQVYPVLPTNQIDPKASYYHTPFTPGEVKEYQFVLENFSTTQKIINITTANALSSPLVNIDYQNDVNTFYSSFVNKDFELGKHILIDDQVVLEPLEKKEINFQIETPINVTEGEILGAISFEQLNQKQPNASSESEMSVKIQRKYTIAVLLEASAEPTISFSIDNTIVDVQSGEPLVYTTISNNSAAIVKGLSLTYQIQKEGSTTPFEEKTISLNTFAPQTTIKQPIVWNHNDFSEGVYSIELSLKNENDEVLSKANKKITIDKKSVDDLITSSENTQKQNIVVVDNSTSIWIIILSIVIALLVLFNFYLNRKRIKMKKDL